MRKIPTLFRRDPANQDRLLREVHPACQWVIDGEGVALHKADGTCMLLGDDHRWWTRRQVKPGKTPPPNYIPVEHDEVTGKTFGWEPAEQSSYAPLWREALKADEDRPGEWMPGTYELVGPKVNGNPELVTVHRLLRHETLPIQNDAPRTYDELRDWLADYEGEGIVWHHPDGRMAKIKRLDVLTAVEEVPADGDRG